MTFLRLVSVTVFAVFAVGSNPALAQEHWPDAEWGRVAPGSAGWSATALASADSVASRIGTAAYLVVQNGRLVHSWGDITARHELHSIRKSVLGAMIGKAVAAGRIDTSVTLAALAIDDADGLSAAERRARVADLLRSRSGVYHPAAYETPGMERNRPPRGSQAPGEFFYYNNWDFNALGTIYRQQTGEDIFTSFARDLAGPLGMQDFRLEDTRYHTEPQSRHAAYLFSLSARDLARFGLMYLRNGRWRDAQVVPSAWVAASVSTASDAGLQGGFGMLWWTAPEGRGYPFVTLPKGSFSARGTGPQLIVAIPAWDLLIVHRVDTRARTEQVSITNVGRLLKAVLDSRSDRAPTDADRPIP